MNLRIQSLDHNYFWRHLHSRAVPTPAPSFGSHGLQGQSKAPTPYLCDWKARGKLELGLSRSCLFVSQGSSSHTHRNVPKPFPNPFGQPTPASSSPFIPALSHPLPHSPPQEAGSPTHWPLQHLPSCLSFPPALKPGSSPHRGSASSFLTQLAAGRESPACLCPQPPYMLVQTLTALVWSRSQLHRHQLEMHQK